MVAALPDALDLVAVGAATGRTPVALLGEIAGGAPGPLAAELALAVAEIEVGARQADALAALRERTGAPELGAVAAALERSRRYGSPLADELHSQAAALRAQEQRRIEERAARAAPKIQLVVAMVLVPSALLAIAAALVAHSDALFAAF
jgi:tight adherence protein C